ncbi:hypothetical protein UFOVP587_7 [uncultured Caudovirales phage]|uniref:Uncharacterized protein n=1 Tax=uncultured Caudovirales phage TaxID=2100421 RepID=A0A6J5MZ64_9CAUD|nr:hypothetical protein UFOVP587_7 [uncultured Caudovirales phage]
MAYKTMNADDIRSAVRSITDLDTADISDSLLDLYIRDGYYRILDTEKRWSFLEYSFTFNTQTGKRNYELSTLSDEPMGQISSIIDNRGTGYRLDMIGFDMAEATYIGSYDTNGDPLFYAHWNGEIHLYPKPNNVRTLICRGYREPLDWQTDGGDVDAIPSLHFPLVYYACSRIYQQLEDTTMAQIYKNSFDEGVSLAIKNATTADSHNMLRLNAAQTTHRPTYSGWLKSLGSNTGNWGP